MADFIPLEVEVDERSPGTFGKAAESPLTSLLSELRRKHAYAAGPQAGVVSGFGVLPYASGVDVEDMARRMLNEAEDGEDWWAATAHTFTFVPPPGNSAAITPHEGSHSPPGSTRERKRLSSFAFKKAHRPQSPPAEGDRSNGDGKGASVESPVISSSPVLDVKRSRRFRTLHVGISGTIGHRAAAQKSYKFASSHADNLLRSTPHLRHLAPASVDLDGRGNFPTSRSFLSQILSPSQPALAPGLTTQSMATEVNGGSSKKGKNSFSPMVDYGTCKARSRANRQASLEFAAFVRVLAHEMSLEQFAAVETEVFTAIFALVHSNDSINRLAGVAALDALIDVPSADEEKKQIKFANNLSNGLRANNVEYEFLAAIAGALGCMAVGAANLDYGEFEITRSLEWLRTDRSDRRLAAVLTLKELARNAPTAFYTKTTQSNGAHGGSNDFIDYIFPVLLDPQPIVRACAADALGACLKVIIERQPKSTTGLLCQVFSSMMDGFKLSNIPSNGSDIGNITEEAGQHASLLCLSEMLDHSPKFMLPRLEEVSSAVLESLQHPKALIRLEAIRLIPRVAQLSPGTFSRRYLKQSLKFLVESATSPTSPKVGVDLRPASYFAMGQVALAMKDPEREGIIRTTIQIRRKENEHIGNNAVLETNEYIYNSLDGDIYTRLDEIFALVRTGLKVSDLPSRGSAGVSSDTRCEALHCGADLVEALGEHARHYIGDLLQCMFATGLSKDLILCMRAIASRLPSEKLLIEDRLLEEISSCLAGTSSIHEICDPFLHTRESYLGGTHSRPASRGSAGTRFRSLPTWTRKSMLSLSSLSAVDSNTTGTPGVIQHRLDRQSSRGSIEDENDEESDLRIFINKSRSRSVVERLVLSLRTLGSFGRGRGIPTFGSCVTLLPFVRHVVASYLSHPSCEVRKEASLACCLLLLPKTDRNFHDVPSMTRKKDSNSFSGLQPMVSCNGLIQPMRLGSPSAAIVEEVLRQLLTTAVSDLSPSVRNSILRSLDSRYDPYLCQAHHLPPLFLLIQDESLAVRAAALRLLGRLALINPAPILPGLRCELVDIILELRSGGDVGGGREAAIRLLVVFLQGDSLKRLVQPFLPSIIEALPLQGVPPRLASASLEALGELSRVTRQSMNPWIHRLIPHMLETMQDQSSSNKQRTSMKTLGQIASSTGYVITPYVDYPQLLPTAAGMLPATKRAPWPLRREVIRTLGILGALDPDRYFAHKSIKGGSAGGGYFIDGEEEEAKQASGPLKSSSLLPASVDDSAVKDPLSSGKINANVTQKGGTDKMVSSTDPGDVKGKDADDDEPAHLYMYEQYAMTAQPDSKLPPARRLTPSEEDFYPTVAVQALTRILKDPSLAVYHSMVMQSVMYIFNNLGLKCVPFLQRIVPHILEMVRTCGQESLREALLQQVASLSGIVRDHLRPYLPAIFDVVEEFWDTNRHLATLLGLVNKMADGVPDDFRNFVPRLVPQILASIEMSHIQILECGAGTRQYASAASQFDRLDHILRSVRDLRGNLGDYLHLLVPALVKLTDALTESVAANGSKNIRGLKRLAIITIQTVSVLLHTTEISSLNNGISARNGLSRVLELSPSSSSLPARATQPLMRFLSRDPHVTKDIGFALIEAICVCAKRLGKDRWVNLFHFAARNAILNWQQRIGLVQSTGNVSTTGVAAKAKREAGQVEIVSEMAGLVLYDRVIKNITSPLRNNGNIVEGILPGEARWQITSNESRQLLSGNGVPDNVFDGHDVSGDVDLSSTPSLQPLIPNVTPSSTHRVNQSNLKRSWDVSQRSTREDWDEWMRRFAVQLLRESPSAALRATAGLAQAYQPLARELFAAAFVCCWTDLNDQYRSHLVQSLEAAFVADVSPEILQTLLNLAEYMEHDGVDGDLPIDISILADLALKCRNYAKALYYKEREHAMRPDGGACIEDLISINRKLDLPEAALGAVKAAQVELERQGGQSWDFGGSVQHQLPSRFFRHQAQDMAYSVMASADEIAAVGGGSWAGVQMQESWLAKLGSWSEALVMYEGKLEEDPGDIEAILGCMRCLDARGEWRKVIELAKNNWIALSSETSSRVSGSYGNNPSKKPKSRRRASKFCAEAAWRLGQWDELETYATQLSSGIYDPQSLISATDEIFRDGLLPKIDFDASFYNAVLNIHRKEWSLAAEAIDGARRAIDSRLTALMSESYKRAYPSMVTAQTLSEMEEIVAYRKLELRAVTREHQHPANRADAAEAREELLSVWRRRLAGCRVDAEVHASILAVRSLVLGPTDDVDSILTLSMLSRQSQQFKLAERALIDPLQELGADMEGIVFGFDLPSSLGLGLQRSRDENYDFANGVDRLVTGDAKSFLPRYDSTHEQYHRKLVEKAGDLNRLHIQHKLYFAYLKHLWATDHQDEAIARVAKLCNVVDMVVHFDRSTSNNQALRVACWLKRGEWKIAQSNQAGTSQMSECLQMEVLTSYKRATASKDCGYKAWHAWALVNFRLAQQMQDSASYRFDPSLRSSMGASRQLGLTRSSASTTIKHLVVAAVKGFVTAIGLGTKRWSASVQQDMLNFLACLFMFGELPEVAATINMVIESVTLESWLGVLPQLLARIHIKGPSVRSILHSLLIRLGSKHPQAMMYPLSVLLKSPVLERKTAAESLMSSLKTHSSSLVGEALMVSSELIRVAILWLELWWEGLEDASRLYFGEGNVKGMLDVLIPLHEQLEGGPKTRRETEFYRSFGRDLAEAHSFVKEYTRLTKSNGGEIPSTGGFAQGSPEQGDQSGLTTVRQNAEAEAALNQAWDLYYTVFRRINKQLPGLTSLELSQCSPALQHARHLELGVPGSYRVDGSYIRIAHFVPKVQVITSKQRPRKITLLGNDGKDYVFLLKGHEDLRQDERVMQLFGLANALLARDRRTNQYDLDIKRYAIAPLSHNAGVVGWVPHCDTLHSLIRDYRESKKVALNMENREMMKLSPNYDLLTVMQKVEVFSEALDRTTGKGNDLYEVLWTKSTNSEEWLERRTKFTRSLAVMSMVGYILGLGDRHPSNLMLDQISGRVLHIDFGDCFEVAMHRDKFPEKVPFRLTRMLIKAMEACGVEGSYRSTCERTMGVLRDNRDSLIAMLEAFVYDPLISWRLLGDEAGGDEESQEVQAPFKTHTSSRYESFGSAQVSKPISSAVLQGTTIQEEKEEDGLDEDDRDWQEVEGKDGNPIGVSSHAEAATADIAEAGDEATSLTHAKSIKMYSSMQSMAAAFSASTRIASITGGDSRRVAVTEGSLVRSRIDRSIRQREATSIVEGDEGVTNEEAMNEKALKVIRRVQDKLAGTDFAAEESGPPLDVQDQVQRLIVQATSSENLCQLFIGWCAFW